MTRPVYGPGFLCGAEAWVTVLIWPRWNPRSSRMTRAHRAVRRAWCKLPHGHDGDDHKGDAP